VVTDTGHEILLTGATGFVGKVVLEALLRRREELGVTRVHLLIRPGADASARERFAAEVERSPCLGRLPAGWTACIDVVEGDLTQPGCGLAPQVHERLAARLTHVLHVAASIDFDLPVAEAEVINVGGSLNVLDLARTARRLERMVSVSTAYVTPHPGNGVLPVYETLVPLPSPAAEIRDAIRERTVDTGDLLDETGHPNTYTLTKCLAEHLLVEGRGDVPLSIVRPSIVSASWREPFPGWIDSTAAFGAFVALVATGHLRAVVARPESRIDLVPVDVVARRILDAAFDTATPRDGVPIFFAVGGLAQNPTIEQCRKWLVDFFRRHPIDRRPYVPYLGPPGPLFRLSDRIHHDLRVRVAALFSRRARRSATKLLERLRYLNHAFPYFTQNTFDFRSKVVKPAVHPPREYVEMVCRGIYRHLSKRKRPALPDADPGHGSDSGLHADGESTVAVDAAPAASASNGTPSRDGQGCRSGHHGSTQCTC
jgi:alcohol-forming fatty acyl-CoA reductase